MHYRVVAGCGWRRDPVLCLEVFDIHFSKTNHFKMHVREEISDCLIFLKQNAVNVTLLYIIVSVCFLKSSAATMYFKKACQNRLSINENTNLNILVDRNQPLCCPSSSMLS